MKRVIVILDGLGDLPSKELSNKTPLGAAYTPNLNYFTKKGRLGLMYVINKNIAPESDEAMLSILGYDPFKYYTGRGLLEAYGTNVRFKKGSVVLRCNFVEVRGDIIKNIEPKVSKEIIETFVDKMNNINLGVKHKFVATVGHRAVLMLERGSDKVSNTHPGYNIIKNYVTSAVPVVKEMKIKKCLAFNKEAKKTADAINKFVKESKNMVDGYAIITRGAGKNLPKLKKLNGWALMADMPVEIAIGKLSGMKIIKKTNDYKSDAKLVVELAKKHNVYIQIKGPDSFGHAGDAIGKKKIIETIDKEFFSELKNLKAKIIITADHSTPYKYKSHSKDPVPLLIYGNGRDNSNKFSEEECKKGGLGYIYGLKLMKIIQ